MGIVVLAACEPDLDQRASRVAGTRVLAVSAEPAEAEPRDPVTFTALVSDGTVPTWAICTARKPLAELGPVSPTCYSHDAASFVPLGAGLTVAGTMPTSACRDFGPEVPQAKAGEPYGRPVDPDPTGGYYQPLTLFVGPEIAVAQPRISCGVSGASSDDQVTFRQRYHVNANPQVADLTYGAVARGARVPFTVSWPACPTTDVCGDGVCGPDEPTAGCPDDCGGAHPKTCAGAERYLYFDGDARSLVVRRESIRVSWFATAGLFDRDRTGREGDDLATSSDNVWVAPEEPGNVRIFVVLRDDRGGVAWRTVDVSVP